MSDSKHKADPQMASILKRLKARDRGRELGGGIAAARDRARKMFAHWNRGGPRPRQVQDRRIPGAFGYSKLRIYTPDTSPDTSPDRPLDAPLGSTPGAPTSESAGTLIYFHGGGWIVGDLELEDRFLRTLCVESGLKIISVEYALAPEHKFPEPLEDCLHIVQQLQTHAAEWKIDVTNLFLGGGSAGANLAMATALKLRDLHPGELQGLLLVTGVFTTSDQSESRQAFADGSFSPGGPGMEFFLSQYLKDDQERQNPMVSTVLADLFGLPPVHLIAAELDTLRDDSVELNERLHQAGVQSSLRIYPGVIHGFTLFLSELDCAHRAVTEAASWLRNQAGLQHQTKKVSPPRGNPHP